MNIISTDPTLSNAQSSGRVSYSLYNVRHANQPEILDFPKHVVGISLYEDSIQGRCRGGRIAFKLKLELTNGNTAIAHIMDNNQPVPLIEPKASRKCRHDYSVLPALAVSAGERVGVDSVFRNKAEPTLIVRLERLEDIRYGMMYTPLEPRGPSLNEAGRFDGECTEIAGLRHSYGMGVITSEVLTAWELIVKTEESGKFHVGW